MRKRNTQSANQSIVLVLHGLPGSGKSTFASKIAKGSECGQWVIVCQDVLGSKKKCEEKFKHALLQRCNIIVDRTFWVGVYPGLGEDELAWMIDAVHAFCARNFSS